jgi:hypothetical protein
LVSFGTFRTQIERRRPYIYIIGLSGLLLDKARIKESEKTEKGRVFPAHHCSLHIRMQCGVFILIEILLDIICECFLVIWNYAADPETM